MCTVLTTCALAFHLSNIKVSTNCFTLESLVAACSSLFDYTHAIRAGQTWQHAVQVGRTFQEVSEGHFTERIAPFLMQAAPFAGVDRLPFQQALQNAVRDKRKVCHCLLCFMIGDCGLFW